MTTKSRFYLLSYKGASSLSRLLHPIFRDNCTCQLLFNLYLRNITFVWSFNYVPCDGETPCNVCLEFQHSLCKRATSCTHSSYQVFVWTFNIHFVTEKHLALIHPTEKVLLSFSCQGPSWS
jgi:hypothetical protein